VSEDEAHFSMSLPVDSDRLLRRECPTCERELKWQTSADADDETPAPDGGYYCPYCGIQGPPDAWWTKEQLEHAKTIVFREAVAPELEKLRRSVNGASSGGFVSISMTGGEAPALPAENAEDDGMRRVDFSCHDEPVKILESWDRPVHCPICGQQTS
jgi:hypothetical protein